MKPGKLPFFGMAAVLSLCILAQAQMPATGKDLFERRCGGCHTLDRNTIGPRLRGVYGRAAGSAESFAYSNALRQSNITWNDRTLDQWLTDTDQFVPDNEMNFRVERAEERNAIIAYLKLQK